MSRAAQAEDSSSHAQPQCGWRSRPERTGTAFWIERDGHVLLESLALFIRYELMVQAPLAEADEAARAIGRDRFEAFIARVGEALASGQRTLAASAKDNGGGR